MAPMREVGPYIGQFHASRPKHRDTSESRDKAGGELWHFLSVPANGHCDGDPAWLGLLAMERQGN